MRSGIKRSVAAFGLAFALTGMAFSGNPAMKGSIRAVFAESAEETGTEKKTESAVSTTAKKEKATEAATQEPETTEDTAAQESSSKAEEDSSGSKAQTTAESGSTEDSSSGKDSSESEKKSEKNTAETSATVRSKKDAEITQSATKKITKEVSADAPTGADSGSNFIAKIYTDTRLAMKANKEYIAGYVYFNQGDSAWNQNGYCIAKAGCGPTSMAVVITSLTGQWVTPLDTAIWGYQHHYYSSEGSVHEMIPAMAAAYGLDCEGVGQDYQAIKKALKQNHPVVALMGPGYFTRGGHFMVLVAIDDDDCVTVADVGSRKRSSYKYHLSDIISQSKSAASAGGPFWVMSYNKLEAGAEKSQTVKEYVNGTLKDSSVGEESLIRLQGSVGNFSSDSDDQKVTVKRIVEVLSASDEKGLTGSSLLSVFHKKQVAITVYADTGQQADVESLAGSSEGLHAGADLGTALKTDISDRIWEGRFGSDGAALLEAYQEGRLPE